MLKVIVLTAAMGALTAPVLAEAPPAPPQEAYVAPTAQTCEPVSIRLYFQNGEVMLSSHARDVVMEARERLSDCNILSVDMVALSADGRTLDEINDIGADRLETVAAVLRDEGLLPVAADARIETSGVERNTLMARRVEITLNAYDPKVG